MTQNLILLLGDQLTPDMSSLRGADKTRDVILICEVWTEATYVPHHKKKIAFIFSSMRHFAEELRERGWIVDYRTLDQTGASGSFTTEIEHAVSRHQTERVVVTSPGEWRVLEEIRQWHDKLGMPVDIRDDDRFICSTSEFAAWAESRTQLRMEYFYREMRQKTGLLMDGDKPEGGQWNFDKENRKPAKPDLFMPQPLRHEPDTITRDVLDLVARRFDKNFGDLEPFWFGVTRTQAEAALDHFLKTALPRFGDFQDAMLEGEAFLYHSVLSIYINVGLLDPLDVCRRVESAHRAGRVPLNCAEGYIRQIIGWREYVRGIYWLKMPAYVEQNYFAHTRSVPDFYWTGDTDMACLRAAIGQTKREAYAHHIQRLMLTGNFALLAGVSPHALHEWYLLVYADAFEWVELPNTLGMSQFGDGGLLASKPYVASGAYINRMSNHCKGCRYDVKKPYGPDACPFNPLYWAFLDRHRDKLSRNPRMTQMYRTWDRLSEERRQLTLSSANAFLSGLDAPKTERLITTTSGPGSEHMATKKSKATPAETKAEASASQLIDARIAELSDWRGATLASMRALIKEADPEVVETWKWRGVPVWEHAGIICTGETYKAVVKLTFAKGASLEDPTGLFNASLDGNTRRAIDIHENDNIDAKALKALIRAAVALNTSAQKYPRPARSKK